MKSKIFSKVLPQVAVVLVGVALATSCEKEKNNCKICGVEDPLTGLNWLKEKVAEFETNRAQHSSICSCKYSTDKDGFLVVSCEECPDMGVELFSCNGLRVGLLFGLAGIGYEQYQIDTNSISFLYKNY